MFTEKQLGMIMRDAGSRVTEFYPSLLKWMEYYSINSLDREAGFLATIAVESGELRWMKEIWGPTTAQAGYEGRDDLGNTQPGDGERYMGRCPIQITGRKNYTWARDFFDIDCVAHPELLEQPNEGIQVACGWWKFHGLNEIADTRDFEHVRRKVNGGMNGWAKFQTYTARALQILSTPDFSNVESGGA